MIRNKDDMRIEQKVYERGLFCIRLWYVMNSFG